MATRSLPAPENDVTAAAAIDPILNAMSVEWPSLRQLLPAPDEPVSRRRQHASDRWSLGLGVAALIIGYAVAAALVL